MAVREKLPLTILRKCGYNGPATRSDSRGGGRKAPVRKVRAPQGKETGNARRGGDPRTSVQQKDTASFGGRAPWFVPAR